MTTPAAQSTTVVLVVLLLDVPPAFAPGRAGAVQARRVPAPGGPSHLRRLRRRTFRHDCLARVAQSASNGCRDVRPCSWTRSRDCLERRSDPKGETRDARRRRPWRASASCSTRVHTRFRGGSAAARSRSSRPTVTVRARGTDRRLPDMCRSRVTVAGRRPTRRRRWSRLGREHHGAAWSAARRPSRLDQQEATRCQWRNTGHGPPDHRMARRTAHPATLPAPRSVEQPEAAEVAGLLDLVDQAVLMCDRAGTLRWYNKAARMLLPELQLGKVLTGPVGRAAARGRRPLRSRGRRT